MSSTSRARAACLVATILLAMGACRQGSAASGNAATPVTDSMLLATGADSANWPMFGGNYGNTRYSPLAQINATNVRDLQIAWEDEIGASWSERLVGWRTKPLVWYRPRTWSIRPHQWGKEQQLSTPLAVDGVLYYTGAYNLVVAVDAASGAELWRYQHRMRTPPLLCCGPHNRGLAAYGDKVFISTLDARLVALDKRTGTLAWDVEIADPKQNYSVTMAPLAVDGKVIVGVSGADFAIRGRVDAYDARTGTRVWRFWTIPSPEEGGWWGKWSTTTADGDSLPRDIAQEKADSAKYPDSWQRGGGSVWMTPAYDPSLGLLFVGVGNPSPALDDATRPGDNLYTASMVALDVKTGILRWYYQLVPHDLLDTDVGSPLVLFDVVTGDSTVPAVGHASKKGWVYVADRRTGAPILRSEPFEPQKNVFARPTAEGIVAYPAIFGGSRSGLPAYSARTGLLYVLSGHIPTFIRRGGGGEFGGQVAPANVGGQWEAWGTVAAVDVGTGKIKWRHRTAASLATYGALVTAGDLLVYSEGEVLVAADARDGRILWRHSLGRRVEGPPISFLVNGRQYIAAVSSAGLVALTLPRVQASASGEPGSSQRARPKSLTAVALLPTVVLLQEYCCRSTAAGVPLQGTALSLPLLLVPAFRIAGDAARGARTHHVPGIAWPRPIARQFGGLICAAPGRLPSRAPPSPSFPCCWRVPRCSCPAVTTPRPRVPHPVEPARPG